MEFSFRNTDIDRGDIVKYYEKICFVAECNISPTIYLINLGTGLIAGEFENIRDVRDNITISLLAKGRDLLLSNTHKEQEVPF